MSETSLRLGLPATSDEKLAVYLRGLCEEPPAICEKLTVEAILYEAVARLIERSGTLCTQSQPEQVNRQESWLDWDLAFRKQSAAKYAALLRPLESGLRILYQAPQLAPESYRYWFGEDDHGATAWMLEMRLQNALLKLHSELPALILGDELPAETKGHIAALRQVACSHGSADGSGACTASQSHPGALQSGDHSSPAEDADGGSGRQSEKEGGQ